MERLPKMAITRPAKLQIVRLKARCGFCKEFIPADQTYHLVFDNNVECNRCNQFLNELEEKRA